MAGSRIVFCRCELSVSDPLFAKMPDPMTIAVIVVVAIIALGILTTMIISLARPDLFTFDPILDTYARDEGEVEARGLQYTTDASGAQVTLATHDAHKWADPSILDYFVSFLPSFGDASAKGFHNGHRRNSSHKGGSRNRKHAIVVRGARTQGVRTPAGANMFNQVMSLDAQMARGALEGFAVVAPTLRIGDVVDLYRLTGLSHLDPESPLDAVRVRGMIFSRARTPMGARSPGVNYAPWRYIASVGDTAILPKVDSLGAVQDSDDPMGQIDPRWDLRMLINDGDETKSPMWSSPFPRQDSLLIWVWAQSGGLGRLVLQSGRVYDFDGRFVSVGTGY